MLRKITHIIIHCSYTYSDMDIGANEIRKWHVHGNGWSDIGYHYIIRRDGSLEKGREENVQGAHARGMNKESLGVCLVGGKSRKTKKATVNYTQAQWSALNSLCVSLLWHDKYTIIGHNDVPNSNKTCPNFDVKAWASTLQA